MNDHRPALRRQVLLGLVLVWLTVLVNLLLLIRTMRR